MIEIRPRIGPCIECENGSHADCLGASCSCPCPMLALAPGLRVAVEIAKDRLAALRAHDSDAMRARPAAIAAIEDVLVFLEAAADRTSRGEHPHARTPLT